MQAGEVERPAVAAETRGERRRWPVVRLYSRMKMRESETVEDHLINLMVRRCGAPRASKPEIWPVWPSTQLSEPLDHNCPHTDPRVLP